MRISVVTLFPEMFDSVLSASVFGRAMKAGLVQVDFVNPRDFATNKHKSVDDTPYGGGPGMVMKCDSLVSAIESVSGDNSHRVLLSPVGKAFDHKRARELAGHSHIVFVCGRYEGIDERVVDLAIDESLSIGDYVLTGGELGAMVIMDAIARFVPEVLGHAESADDESFASGLLEYPQYTRPAEFRGREVPEVLFSGHHAKIKEWRHEESLRRTAIHRPELFANQDEPISDLAARTYVVLAHHPVLDRNAKIVTTSITNFDIHDIARACTTFGIAGYFPATPIALQREKMNRIVDIWRKEISQAGASDRGRALGRVTIADSIESAITAIESRHKHKAWVVATSAQPTDLAPSTSYKKLLADRCADRKTPMILVLGTGWGLHSSVYSLSNQVLMPVEGIGDYNHLSVRSALAAILDRIFGKGSQATP